MELASKYDPRQIEEKWYQFWLDKKLFHSEPDHRVPYTVVIPPPNVTGVLHMGHMLNNTIQDVLVRRARMQGKNACWVPGTDHASIATEAKVVKMLADRGIDKRSLSRDEFMKYAWEWKEEHGGIILKQLRKLGASCDWDRTAFTMDEVRYESVIRVFVDLYNKGLIYRGVRMVNWDPQALTAVSDEEVIYKESHGKLFYLRYFVEGEDKYIVVATTRPETIMGDTAVCVHPEDERYQWLKGKKVVVPGVGRVVPIIMDEYVDREFGTGALKITPAHDINDYNLGMKYNLESIDIFNDNGTLNEHGGKYAGMDRFACRKQIVKDLEEAGLIEKIEDYTNKVGHSERTDAVIEPKLSAQWFLKMEGIAKRALEVVEDDTIRFHPTKFKNTYRHWLENIKDWCISRQLWWGQRIPAWYLEKDGRVETIVALNEEEARKVAAEKYGYTGALRQDEDVLDTWFSSWLWPISLFDGIRNPDNPEIKYYYPTADLITAPDIIFFWVARMIMAGEEFMGKQPFSNVYFTGIVRDKIGRKMSKTLGNSPNPLDLIDTYGADAVRIGMLLCSSAGNDIFYDEAQIKQGAAFCNKIWNSYRLVKGFSVDVNLPQSAVAASAIEWFGAKLSQTVALVEDHYSKFRISDALMTIYKLFWDDYCSWYLEAIKPAYGQPIDAATQQATLGFFESLLKLIHPVMPFITEELWQDIAPRKEGETIMYAATPKAQAYKQEVLDHFALAMETVNGARGVRSQRNLPPKEQLNLKIKGAFPADMIPVVEKLSNCVVEIVPDFGGAQGVGFMVRTLEMFVVLEGKVNVAEELEKAQKELLYQQQFLDNVRKKLSNERFVANAPAAVIENERKKESDSLSKIESLQAKIKSLEESK